MTAINIKAYSLDDSQIKAINALFKSYKIKYTITKTEEKESSYDPAFVAMIKKGEEDLKNGKGIKMSVEELDKLWK